VAGCSIGLNNEQIMELSKLDKGVAAIYQNNWLEAVLTKIDKSSSQCEISSVPVQDRKNKTDLIGKLLIELIARNAGNNFDMPIFNEIINNAEIPEFVKKDINNLFLNYQKTVGKKQKKFAYSELVFKLINCNDLFRIYEDKLPNTSKLDKLPEKSDIGNPTVKECKVWIDYIIRNLDIYADLEEHTKEKVFNSLLYYKILSELNNSKKERYQFVHYCINNLF
jgi:hypothetical protein